MERELQDIFNEKEITGVSYKPPVLSEMPGADASKAGQQFWFNGTLWTYAQEGQFGTLAEGTPWPVKGYKELSAYAEYISGSSLTVYEELKSDGINAPTVSGTRDLLTLNFGAGAWGLTSEVNFILSSALDTAIDGLIDSSAIRITNGDIMILTSGSEEAVGFSFLLYIYPPTS